MLDTAFDCYRVQQGLYTNSRKKLVRYKTWTLDWTMDWTVDSIMDFNWTVDSVLALLCKADYEY